MSRILYISERVFVNSIFWAEQGIHRKFKSRKSAAYRRGPEGYRQKREAASAESAGALICRSAGAAYHCGPEGYRQKKEAASAESACALSRKADAAERAGGTKAVGIRENVWRHGPAPAPRPPLSAARRGRPACGRTNRAPVVPHRYQIPLPFSEKIVKIALHRARIMVN